MKGVLDEFCIAVQSGAPEYQDPGKARSEGGSDIRSKSVDSKGKAEGGFINGLFS
jgi:hypothetical protein